MIPGMWIYTLDDRVLNSALIEYLELIEAFPEGTDLGQAEAELVEPDYYEIVAMMGSGDEALLHSCEDPEEAYVVYELLVATLARGAFRDGTAILEPVSVHLLLERERQSHN